MCSLKHKSVTVTSKKTINSAMHVMECPVCKTVIASASERSLLPQFTTCNGLNDFPVLSQEKSKTIKKYTPISLGIGSVVEHKVFGLGVILAEDDKRVDIDFDKNGKKNLLKQFANLKLVN